MYGLFEVIEKNNSEITRIVYGVYRNTKNNKTDFLIFDENGSGWMWVPADFYEPIIPKRTLLLRGGQG